MPSRQRNYELAIRLYQAAVNAGASPTNALALTSFAHAESGFNQTHIGGDPGSPEGMSYGLMQTGGRLYGISNRTGATRSPEAALQFYIGYLQQHQPDLWTQMQSSPDVHGVWQALHNTGAQGFALGRQTDTRGQTYADRLSQALTPAPSPTPLPIDIPPANLHDPYGGFNPAYSPHYPSPFPQPTNIPFSVPPSFPNNIPPVSTPYPIPQPQLSTSQQSNSPQPGTASPFPYQTPYSTPVSTGTPPAIPVYSPINVDVPYYTPPIPDPTEGVWEGYNGSPVPSPYVNQQPWNEELAPVDTYSQQPIDTTHLDYEPLWPVDTYSDQISSPGEITDNPFTDESWMPQQQSPAEDLNGWKSAVQQSLDNASLGDWQSGVMSSLAAHRTGSTGGFGVGAGPGFGVTPAGFSTGYTPFGGGGVGPKFSPGGLGGGIGGTGGGGRFTTSYMHGGSDPFGGGTGGSMPTGFAGWDEKHRAPAVGEGDRETKHGMFMGDYLDSLPQPTMTPDSPQYISDWQWIHNSFPTSGGSQKWGAGVSAGDRAGLLNARGHSSGWFAPIYAPGAGTNAPMPTAASVFASRKG